MTLLRYVASASSALTLALSLAGCADEETTTQPTDAAEEHKQECTTEEGTNAIQASPQRDGVGTSPSTFEKIDLEDPVAKTGTSRCSSAPR